jgi:hypothetical protein
LVLWVTSQWWPNASSHWWDNDVLHPHYRSQRSH